MRRLYIAISMFLIAITLCIGEVMIVKEAFGDLNSILESTEQSYPLNKETAKSYAKNAYSSWQKYNIWLSLFLNNEIIEEISLEIVSLNDSISRSDFEFQNSLSNLKLLLKNIKENEEFNLLGAF